jgi:hypothetical protein
LSEEEVAAYRVFAEKYAKTVEKNSVKWQKLLKDRKKLEHILSSKAKSVVNLIRQGIPPQHRGEVWYLLSGAGKKAEFASQYYSYLLANIATAANPTTVANIDLDLHRTFPENILCQSPDFRDKLRRILIAYSIRNPSVGTHHPRHSAVRHLRHARVLSVNECHRGGVVVLHE